ncbi:hypothetical protein [Nocardia sp. NPDC057440]|uniref:hypothetical protein n=1 Tax=Nocardia sp. NPDC057440 TaxID=3346134 RepID=UPI003671D520
MTTPHQTRPDDAYEEGSVDGSQDWTESTIKAVLKGAPIGSFMNAQDTHNSEVKDPLNAKPDVQEIPINSAMWNTMDQREQPTFPRTQLISGTASGTASGGAGDGSHTHSLNRIPDYQPSGNGNDYLEIGFIRIQKNCTFTHAGFITGDSATFAGVNGCYLGVYRMQSNGDLTLLNTSSATSNLQSSITTQNTEHIFNLGITRNALQDEIYAVGILQDTGLFQTAASLMCTRVTDLSRPTSGLYPRKAYAYAGIYSAMPSSISEASLNYSGSTKLPFFYLREV